MNETTTLTNPRELRGQHIATHSSIKQENGFFFIPSASGKNKNYRVNLGQGTCTCADFTFRKMKCKHLFAAQIRFEQDFLAAIPEAPKPEPKRVIAPVPARKTYPQKWSAYNAAQTSEKREFQRLLALLCSGVREPEQTFGRPRLPLADMIFACVFKSYSTFSGRRFATDLQDAHERGHLSQLPHYNSLFRYFEKPEMTPILEMLIAESSKPLAALESSFAVDATGLGTTHGFTWHYAKYQQPRMIAKKEWKKLHVITGTVTNVICGAKVTDKSEHDSNYFAPLVEAASKNFEMREIMADAAYLSKANLETAVSYNAFPYIAWKSNSRITEKKPANELWNKLYHLFSLNREQFLSRYGQRSNNETTFSMLKMKFGGTLRSKSAVAQENEALAKCLCHNLCCLIQSMFEFGIEPEFGNVLP